MNNILFQKWKEDIETKTKSYFKTQRTRKKNHNRYIQYVCHRSGVYTSKVKGSNRQRRMKVKGTNKIGFSCPARIELAEKGDGKICILFVMTHVGHQNEIGRTRLLKSQREEIAESLLRGIPNHRILKDIGKNFNPDNRLSYSTNKDIHNIKKAFNIQVDVNNLFGNLSKIVDFEKRKEVKKQLKLIINELDENTFVIECRRFVENLLNDPMTEKYGQYFATYYAERPSQWAHCYKKHFQKNTNMSLEKWQHELKCNSSVGGKCQQRLDLGINNVVECLGTKFLKRLVSVCHNRVPYKLSELRKRHKMASEIADEVVIFEEISNSKWQVASSRNKSSTMLLEFYTVTKNEEACDNCNFRCQECQSCVHELTCTCHDYSIQFNMCKHIHLVRIKYPRSNSLNQNEVANKSNLFIEDNNNVEELNIVCKELQEYQKNRHVLEKSKELFKNKIASLTIAVDQCQSVDVMAHVNENLTSLLSSTQVFSKPHQH